MTFSQRRMTAYSGLLQPRRLLQWFGFHALFGKGYAVLEQQERPTSASTSHR
jgi:hypothetical protein